VELRVDSLLEARVLVEIGELEEAEALAAHALEENGTDLTALSLFAKIKHIRGELSQAIACWAELHARSPHNEIALAHLRAMLHLAEDPERGAGEFLLFGVQLGRNPAARLELEDAFRLFLQRRTQDARARCSQLARRWRHRDRELFKLAVLAGSWIAELAGDLESACETLESLGAIRGFEHDIDRVLALARIYERIGTRTRLEAAVNVCRHLETRFEKISVQGRLAALYARLGDEMHAREYGERYLRSFRRRMHRPSQSDVVRVAAQRYLPLAKLRAIRAYEADPPDGKRERSLLRALRGDLLAAQSELAQGEDVLDLKYGADAAALLGDDAAAARGFVDAFAEDPHDLSVLLWLIERAPGDPFIARFLRETDRWEAAHALLEAQTATRPLAPEPWRALAGLLALDPERLQEAARAAARSEAAAQAATRSSSAIGRVLAAGVYHFIGKAKGIIHEVWAGRVPAEAAGRGGWLPDSSLLGNLSAEMRDAVRNTFLAVREYVHARFPHLTTDILDYNYTFKVPKEDEPSGGLSAGLPCALAFASVFLQRPISQDLAASGVVVADAHDVLNVRAVGDIEFKVKAAYNRNLRMILLPAANRAALEASVVIPPAISGEMIRYVGSLEEAMRWVFGSEAFR
jgi:hypothetical protein